MPVILPDTFEGTGDRTHRAPERSLQRVVWLMPNAFFVITGRSRLRWADQGLHGQLDRTGRAARPGPPGPTRRRLPHRLTAAETLGRPGRHHRALGDAHWAQGDMNRAATAYEATRNEAEHHGVAGERATSQAQRAFVLAFTDPDRADDEIHLAQQLLTKLRRTAEPTC
ncbi:hypothetical protein ACF1A9_32025 [Streptomyces sp. NPDC014872]|uniref:hypothetical protein n=1 Tax=Streptomyces sp. NPDC014872 TaxID=3364926 RepID=UPI0036F86129